MTDSFPIQLLRRHLSGATVEELAAETGIPSDRISMRLRAAVLSLHSRGMDRLLPVPARRLEEFYIDWDLLWFN